MEKGKTKKEYRKPQVKQVKLLPEEAVLMNCKPDLATTAPMKCNCTTGSALGS